MDVTIGALTAGQCYIAKIRPGVFLLTLDKCTPSLYCPYSGICRYDPVRFSKPAEGEDENMTGADL